MTAGIYGVQAVEKVELKSNGTLSVVLKNTDSTDGEEHLIGNLITLL